MKYKKFIIAIPGNEIRNFVSVSFDQNNFVTFEADESNSDYLQFLENNNLTHEEILAATTDTWITI